MSFCLLHEFDITSTALLRMANTIVPEIFSWLFIQKWFIIVCIQGYLYFFQLFKASVIYFFQLFKAKM